MRSRVRRRALGALALAATLLMTAPAAALAAGPRAERGGDAWSLSWQRLADLWEGMREAAAGLIPNREAAKASPSKPPPTPKPPPPKRGNPTNNNGDEGGGINPDG